jgi:hypothetical protein
MLVWSEEDRDGWILGDWGLFRVVQYGMEIIFMILVSPRDVDLFDCCNPFRVGGR